MAHPLEQKIALVRRQARRLLVFRAVGQLVGWVLLTVLLLGAADYLIRFQDHGIRLMCSLAVVVVACAACYRSGALGWRRMLGDVSLAQRIERRFPVLTDKLASAVQFLKQPEADLTAGSAALRRAVIIETDSQVEKLDVTQVFDRRPARRALTTAGVALLLVLIAALVAPSSARMALVRLARPFGQDAWPRYYGVAFRQAPTRLATGQTFEVELINDAGHRVPDEARIQYRYDDGASSAEVESEPMHLLDGTMVAHKENVTRPFWYRAEGGDDQSMEWIHLEVVEPPRLESLQLTLHPPQYSGLPVTSSEKSIHALRGTRVELAGTSTKKLRSAEIVQENGPRLKAALSDDAYGFSLATEAGEPLVIDKSGPYWIELQDSEGLTGGADDRWDIRAVADQAPSVAIQEPAGNIFVTPQGEVPLKFTARDDLGLREISLHYARSDRTDVEDFAIPLYTAAETAPRRAAADLPSGGNAGESREVEHRWSLESLNLKPGVQLTFWGAASDYLPQTGKSAVRRLSIITPHELEERLAQRQQLVFGELQRVLKMQQDARSQTKSLEIQLKELGRLNKPDVDNAQAAELNQRQIARTLTSQTEGIPAQIEDFLADLENNRVDSPDLQRHMQAIGEELDRLHEEHLTTIDRELTGAIKAAQSMLPAEASPATAEPQTPDPQLERSLTTAGENQDQVISSLENMLGELGQWDNYRRFARDVAQLQRNQEEIARAAKEIGQRTLSRDWKDLDAQQQADLKKLAAQQTELSRRLEKVQQQMAQMAASLTASDPLSAATVSDALHRAQQQGISGQMRQTSDQLEKNQIGQALAQQAKIAKNLEELMAILSNRREQELTRLVQQLREAEQELGQLREDQQGLRKQMGKAADPTQPANKRQLERLAREQKKIEEETARLARRLERLQAERAGRTTAGAAGKMSRSGNAEQGGDAAGAEQQAEQAEKDLEEAQQQLAQRRRQAEEDLAREQLARIEDALKSLLDRQAKLAKETRTLEQSKVEKGLTRAQRSTIRDVARQQGALRDETAQMAEKLAAAEVVQMALEGAERQMRTAADLLDGQDTGAATQAAQEAARVRCEQLLSALSDKPREPKEGQQQGGGEGNGGGGQGGGGTPEVAQLKLLKILQLDVSARYRKLISGNPFMQGERKTKDEDLSEIAAEQGKLADLALKLSQPADDSPEDDPEKLPDVREPVPGDEASPAEPPANEEGE